MTTRAEDIEDMVQVGDDLWLPASQGEDLKRRRDEALSQGGRPLEDVLTEIDSGR